MATDDELFLADITAYLDAHEPLQVLWGIDSTSLSGDLAHDGAPQTPTAPAPAEQAVDTGTNAISSSLSSSGHQQQQQPINRCVRNVSRERQQRELQELRLQFTELKQQLSILQQTPNQLSQQTLLLATWKRIAERQLVLRTQAEHENWRLREKTQQHQVIAHSMQQTIRQWTSMMNEKPAPPITITPRPTHIAMSIGSSVDPGDVEMYRKLVSELDAEHQRMDSVFRENGLVHWQVAAKTSTMHMKTHPVSSITKDASLYIEVMEADVIPFEMAMVFKMSWQCWHQRKIPKGSVIYEEHFAQTYNEDTSSTILSKMRFDMVANGQSVLMDTLCVVRAYIEHDRISYVFRGITKADGHFPGVYIEETDWWLMKPHEQGNAATATFSCAHMETKQFNNTIGGGDFPVSGMVELSASPLATLCASAYEVDMDQVRNMILNMLLQDNSHYSYSTSDTVAYVRHL